MSYILSSRTYRSRKYNKTFSEWARTKKETTHIKGTHVGGGLPSVGQHHGELLQSPVSIIVVSLLLRRHEGAPVCVRLAGERVEVLLPALCTQHLAFGWRRVILGHLGLLRVESGLPRGFQLLGLPLFRDFHVLGGLFPLAVICRVGFLGVARVPRVGRVLGWSLVFVDCRVQRHEVGDESLDVCHLFPLFLLLFLFSEPSVCSPGNNSPNRQASCRDRRVCYLMTVTELDLEVNRMVACWQKTGWHFAVDRRRGCVFAPNILGSVMDWSAWHQRTKTGWDSNFDLQLLFQSGRMSKSLCNPSLRYSLHVSGMQYSC